MRYLLGDFDIRHDGGPGKSAPSTMVICRHCGGVRGYQGRMPEHMRTANAIRAVQHTAGCALIKATEQSMRKLRQYERDDYVFEYGPAPASSIVTATCKHCGESEFCPSDDLPRQGERGDSPWAEGHAMGSVAHIEGCALARAANRAAESKQ